MSGVPVVIISGWAHGSDAMAWVADALEGGDRRVLSVSLSDLNRERRGGESSGGACREPSMLACAVEEIIAGCGGRACLVGWSAGGMAALESALCFPDGVAGLILMGTAARFCSGDDDVPGTAPAALRAMRRELSREPRRVLEDFFARASHPRRLTGEQSKCKTDSALAMGIDSLIAGLDYLRRVDLRGELKSFERPCLVIHGEDDLIIPWQAGQFLGRNIPGCVSVFLPGAGHVIDDDPSGSVISRIKGFVEDIP